MAQRLLICFSTDLEGALLREQLGGTGGSITLVRTGVGAVNAAHAVTWHLASGPCDAIVVCGIGGAYLASGLRLGEVVCAESECYGDLGAARGHEFLDMQHLGFPTVEGPPPLYNVFPMQVFPTDARVRFVTVNTCTGSEAEGRALSARTGGAVENMEGAAVAHVARLHGIPVGELRGISNYATDRDPGAWRAQEAATAAQEALLAWIASR